jgi:predicted exporter
VQTQRQRWFERFMQASLTRPGWVVACFALLGLGGALLAARLEFRGSFVELLPAGAREVQDLTLAGALTSAITNAAAFLVLLVAQFHVFQQFGLLAGMGVMLAVLAAYGLGPSLLAIAERIRPFRSQASPGRSVHCWSRGRCSLAWCAWPGACTCSTCS